MKLAKKVLMSALSGAMVFQCVPMVNAEKGDAAPAVATACSSEDELIQSYDDADVFRFRMMKMADVAEKCLFLMGVAGVDVNCEAEVQDHFFAGIVNSFSHIFEVVLKPISDDTEDGYGVRPLRLKRENFVPEFLKNPNMNIEQKTDLLRKFGKSLECKLRKNTRIRKQMCEYAANHSGFFKKVEKNVSYYEGLLNGVHDKLCDLVYSNVEKQDKSDVDAKGSESGQGEAEFVTFPTIRVTGPEYEKDYLVSDSESGSGSDSSEEASESEQSDSEEPAVDEGEKVDTEKRDNFMVRFLRFISFGKLFKK